MTAKDPLPLALTMGDPAGCGPDISIQAWNQLRERGGPVFYIHADRNALGGTQVRVIDRPEEAASVFGDALPVRPLKTHLPPITAGTPDTASAPAILESIAAAFADAHAGRAGAMVTNPVSKAVLARAGFAHPGHTEFIAELACEAENKAVHPVMMLVGGGLRVALVTIHLPLREAIEHITQERVASVARITHASLNRDFGIGAPRLALTGLNPHAGEEGLLGTEEARIINPAAETLRVAGIDITDARPADTVYAEMLAGRYDAVIAMTHDQGLIPVKTLDLWGGVNTTLGLPVIRTSPDHGTAYDAARAGTARADSLVAAIELAGRLSASRRAKVQG